jgi:hypothetical protein
MDIKNIYRKIVNNTKYYVYNGTCDRIPTKWITKTKWDYKITAKFTNGEVFYYDTNKNKILVYDNEDPEFNIY